MDILGDFVTNFAIGFVVGIALSQTFFFVKEKIEKYYKHN